jgi:D-alanyl-D-alanine carboxypeptidase
MKLYFQKTLLLFCLILIHNASSASKVALDIDNAIKKYSKEHTLNATFLVTQQDKVLNKGASGFFSFETKKYLEPNQAMPIASGTKPMTAAAILLLHDRGLLKVTDTIATHLAVDSKIWPDNKVPNWANKITIQQLLTHTSGLAEYIPGLKVDVTKEHHDINKEIVKYAVDNPLVFDPGAKYSYCNTGFVMLGLIVERVSNKPLAEFFKTEFFDKFDMHNTFLVPFDVALQYQYNKLSDTYPLRYFAIPTNAKPEFIQVNSDFILSPFSDGGVVSNTEDLCKWNNALHEGKILSEDSYKLMTTPYIVAEDIGGLETHMGYGLFISELKDKQIYYNHAGNALAIRSEYGYLPKSKTCLAILSNIMVQIPEEKKDTIDMYLPANQIDIIYLRNTLLDTLARD